MKIPSVFDKDMCDRAEWILFIARPHKQHAERYVLCQLFLKLETALLMAPAKNCPSETFNSETI